MKLWVEGLTADEVTAADQRFKAFVEQHQCQYGKHISSTGKGVVQFSNLQYLELKALSKAAIITKN